MKYNAKKAKNKAPLFIGIGVAVIVAIIVTICIIKANTYTDYTKDKTTTDEPSIVQTTEEKTDGPSTEVQTPVHASGNKTIMMYVVGSDLESEYNAASSDFEEILSSDFDDDKINLLIYTGGCSDWHNSRISDDNNSIHIVSDGDLVELQSMEQKNMGDADTLSNFLQFGYENYPADQFALILWNHGGGALLGYGYDEISGDCLTLDELDEAFSDSPFSADNKLEWIGFDACLMAGIETADTLAKYANYMIASQESEPGWGWDYSFIDDIQDLSDGAEIGEIIVDTYIDYCEATFNSVPFSYSNVTLSVMDLSKVDAVEEALDNLYDKVNAKFDADSYGIYSHIRATSKEIASEYTGGYSYDIIDLKDLSLKLKTLHPDEAIALTYAIDELVVYSKSNELNANGVSIYHPYNSKEYTSIFIPTYMSFGFAPNYTAYITSFSQLLTGTDTISAEWDIASMVPQANSDMTFSLTLTPEQQACCENAYFVISRTDTDNPSNYMFVAMGNDVSINSDGAATANFDGKIIYMQNNATSEQYEVMYTIQEKTDTYTRYLLSSILFNEDIQEEDAMYAYFVMDVSDENPGGKLLGTYPIANIASGDTTNLFPERYEINPNDYKNIAFGSLSHEFTSEEDLTTLNEADWNDLVLHYNTQPVSDGFSTVSGDMIDGIPYYGMFIFEDIQGNRHCSNLVRLQ
ncbi:MAG: clostripain-related cysteine peptidase [Clostridium sp.]|nr:clostripain-related cysteine peptidase [Clostridium sp.]MCM1398233.1 clostripain-related cysteine peptidase [Clostridium sp.]MCM1460353.1 clostripain-related cysteine peptidase [Bacteroides sp.]